MFSRNLFGIKYNGDEVIYLNRDEVLSHHEDEVLYDNM